MIISFPHKSKPTGNSANIHDRMRTQTAVTVISRPIKMPDGTVTRSTTGRFAIFSGSPEFHGGPPPWGGDDAA